MAPKVREEYQKQIQNRRGNSTVSKTNRFFKVILEDEVENYNLRIVSKF